MTETDLNNLQLHADHLTLKIKKEVKALVEEQNQVIKKYKRKVNTND